LITGIEDDMALMTQETFGPVVPILPFNTEDEVVDCCNASAFGLSASVWSKNLARANRVARRLECGAVSINNVMLTEGNPALPFGGTKLSGYGRQKGEEGLLGYTRSKSILIDKDSQKLEPNWYPYTRSKYLAFDQLIKTMFSHNPLKLLKMAIIGLKLETIAKRPR
ncbi:MAG TPA: aldehyde dehydrogenase, partial [Gammaproteobacteria bacterium]|nr:aldehyde dehydrogenase [Gammaproteobacteria bacterium]